MKPSTRLRVRSNTLSELGDETIVNLMVGYKEFSIPNAEISLINLTMKLLLIAGNTVSSLNRDLNFRYRNKAKKLIPLHREAPSEVHSKAKGTTRRFSKKVRKAKKERFFETLMQGFNVISQQFYPINLSSGDLSNDQKSLLSKGPSFCPVPRDINRVKLLEDWKKIENRLRAAVFFHRDNDTVSSTSSPQPVFPTIKKVSSWKAPVSHVPELERSELSCLIQGIFALSMTIFPLERDRLWLHLRRLTMLPSKFKTKGLSFLVMDKSDYDTKIKEQLENPLHYQKLEQDPSVDYVSVITQWSKKWLEKDQINKEVANWVINNNAKPGKAFGTIKTHKQGNPLRLITSCCGTAIENLSAFTEFYFKPVAQNSPAFVKDTAHFCRESKNLIKQAPFPRTVS